MRIGAFSILVWNQLGFLFLFIDLLFEQVYLKMLVIVFSFNSFLEFHTLLLSLVPQEFVMPRESNLFLQISYLSRL